MTQPKRPGNVSSNATPILPDPQDPAGIAITAQIAALTQFERTVQHENAQANQVNAGILKDYAANVEQRAAYHLPPPKMRDLLPMHASLVQWAAVDGTEHDTQQPGDVVWIEEVEVTQ